MNDLVAEVAILERPLYSVREAARLLRVPTTTLKRWLNGQVRKGVFYEPVIRPEPTGVDAVTWGEFVEAGFLREYRDKGPSFQKIRLLIEQLRSTYGAEMLYPLAHERPFVDSVSRNLFLQVQEEGGPQMLRRAPQHAEGGMQLAWADPVLEFLQKVEFDQDIACRYYPLTRSGMVVIDPDVSFGAPQIEGIRTERLLEAHDAGEPVAEIAASWNISTASVEQALRWERQLLAA